MNTLITPKLPDVISRQLSGEEHKATLVIWLRHFGCRFFQEAKLLLPNLKKELDGLGIGLACVMQGDRSEIDMFWPFENITTIADPYKKTYKHMGFERTSLMKILFASPELKKRRKTVTERGCTMNNEGTKSKSSDVLQLPGMALVDDASNVLWLYRSKDTGDLDLSSKTTELLKSIIEENNL